jgi:hypothetical protein
MGTSHRIAWTTARCHGSQTQTIFDERANRNSRWARVMRGSLAVQWLFERDVEVAEVRMANVRIEFDSPKLPNPASYKRTSCSRIVLFILHLIQLAYLANHILQTKVSRNTPTKWTLQMDTPMATPTVTQPQ